MSSFGRRTGGILLVTGTSIGAGMLALPVATAHDGFFLSTVYLVLSWILMTSGAFCLLQVNLQFPRGSNLITMSRETLGKPFAIATWVAYLLLLYALLSAYISGGGDVLAVILSAMQLSVPAWVTDIIFVSILGSIVLFGIRYVDLTNRGLMFFKLSILALLILLLTPKINAQLFHWPQQIPKHPAIMVLITSFGFASIVPSLRTYFDEDIKGLKMAIIIGSIIPLCCYIIWDAVIMGVIPLDTLKALTSGDTTGGLVHALEANTHSIFIAAFFASFSAICMLTAFLGVSLGLFDFIADGLKLQKQGSQNLIITAITFLPPVTLVLFFPHLYLKALSYAGGLCLFLLVGLPLLMLGRLKLARFRTNL